jgi:Trypsin-like peptidase domain
MDRKQVIVQRARDFFGKRLDEALHMVQQDRQELHGWQEPGHLRAVIRRAAGEATSTKTADTSVAVSETEFGRGAGEPDPGKQREVLGQILQVGAAAMEKIARSQPPELTEEELLGLQCVVLLYARPALQVTQGRLAQVCAFWNILEDQREDIELAQRGVGRIELVGHPDYDWAGTGFLVGETCVMTTRATAHVFTERRDAGAWQFRPGISAWMDYQSNYQQPASAAYRIQGVLGVHDHYDLALLEVEPPQSNGAAPAPLALAAQAPEQLEGRLAYLISYPVRDARRSEPEPIARIFRDVYNVKRVQPGTLRRVVPFRAVQLLQHDCALLGDSAGGCLLDLETHQVLGLHVSSRYLETGTAVPLWLLRDDSLLRRCHVTIAEATTQELATLTSQVERLARTRHWPELRAAVANLYRQAFGQDVPAN